MKQPSNAIQHTFAAPLHSARDHLKSTNREYFKAINMINIRPREKSKLKGKFNQTVTNMGIKGVLPQKASMTKHQLQLSLAKQKHESYIFGQSLKHLLPKT